MKYLIALLAVAGIVVSTMALHVHYMDPGLAPPCAVTVRCDTATPISFAALTIASIN